MLPPASLRHHTPWGRTLTRSAALSVLTYARSLHMLLARAPGPLAAHIELDDGSTRVEPWFGVRSAENVPSLDVGRLWDAGSNRYLRAVKAVPLDSVRSVTAYLEPGTPVLYTVTKRLGRPSTLNLASVRRHGHSPVEALARLVRDAHPRARARVYGDVVGHPTAGTLVAVVTKGVDMPLLVMEPEPGRTLKRPALPVAVVRGVAVPGRLPRKFKV